MLIKHCRKKELLEIIYIHIYQPGNELYYIILIIKPNELYPSALSSDDDEAER